MPIAPRHCRTAPGLSLLLAVFCLSMGLFLPSLAVADEDAQAQAEQLFVEGREMLREDENIEAAELFLEAYELIELPELLYNIAHAYRRGDELALAEKYYQEYLNEAASPPNEDEVIETIFEIQQRRAARKTTLEITTEPAGATITVNDLDESQCQAPCELDLDPGDYELRAELTDYEPLQEAITLEPRETTSTELTLEAQTAYGQLHVQTNVDNATLIAGGESYSLPRSAPVELEAGSQTITLQWGDETVEHTLDIDRDDNTHIFIPLNATAGGDFSLFQTSAIGLGGASLALATAAIVTGLQASATHESLETQQQRLGAVDTDLVQTGQRQKSMTNMLWVGAAVTLAGGAGLWAFDMFGGRSDDGERLEPTPEYDDEPGDDEPGDADAEPADAEPDDVDDEPADDDESSGDGDDDESSGDDTGVDLL